MATFIVGDIHGNATALGTLLVSIEKELREEDAIVFLGDYIDRGPNSRGCVEQILRLRPRRISSNQSVTGQRYRCMPAAPRRRVKAPRTPSRSQGKPAADPETRHGAQVTLVAEVLRLLDDVRRQAGPVQVSRTTGGRIFRIRRIQS